jgi:hypothetical protein
MAKKLKLQESRVVISSINLRPPCPISRFPTPEDFEASAMPPQDSLRLNYLDHSEQVRPELGHPYKQRAITAMQSKTRWCPPQSDVELMTEKQILGFKSAPRLEQVGYKHSERVQDRKHRSQRCDDSASRRESTPDGIFGKDRSNRTERRRWRTISNAVNGWSLIGFPAKCARSDARLAFQRRRMMPFTSCSSYIG